MQDKNKLQEYIDIVQKVARVEYRRIPSHMVDYEELVSIGILAIQALIQNKTPEQLEKYNAAYIATAVRWAIRNELRIRYKWYSLKHKNEEESDESASDGESLDEKSKVREAVYETILSIDGLAAAASDNDSPFDFIKDTHAMPDENAEITELGRMIREAITKGITDQACTIRIPVHMIDKIRLVKRAIFELNYNLGREPFVEEIANKLRMPVKQVEIVLNTIKLEPISLDTPIADNLSLEDYISDENYLSPEVNTQGSMLRIYIDKVLNHLTPKERKIIIGRFGLDGNKPKTLEELGKNMGFSKERIRQIECIALRKLRAVENIKHLKDYLN